MLNLLNVKGKRILGIDYGDRFIGVAVSDILWFLSTPLVPIDSCNCNIIQQITNLVYAYGIGGIVVGYPFHMNGSEGESCEKVRQFVKNIQKALPDMPISLWDERLTTAMAERSMIEANLSRGKRKKKVDSLAASYILQSSLDYLQGQPKQAE